jgi:hypothetical protein
MSGQCCSLVVLCVGGIATLSAMGLVAIGKFIADASNEIKSAPTVSCVAIADSSRIRQIRSKLFSLDFSLVLGLPSVRFLP